MDQLAQKTVSYFYDEEYANHSLGGCNPMRPHRVRLTNRLLEGYNMTGKMQVHRPRALDYDGLNYFHADGALLPPSGTGSLSRLDITGNMFECTSRDTCATTSTHCSELSSLQYHTQTYSRPLW